MLTPAVAAAQSYLHGDALNHATRLDETSVGISRGSIVGAPIPVQNPTVGAGLALAAGYLFTIDPGSRTSVVGLGGFKTNNGSEAYAVGAKFDFGGGKWKIEGAVGHADLTYDLYAGDEAIEIGQTGSIVRFAAAYSLTKAFSVGFELGYIESEIGPGGDLLPDDLRRDFGITTGTAEVLLEYDTRDSTIYPTKGINQTLSLGQGRVVDGFDRDFLRGLGKFNFYFPVLADGVIAGQFTACQVERDTPFFLACSLGGSDSFRGYPSTQYIDDGLASIQIAYRAPLYKRLGYALFAGSGRVARNLGDLDDAQALYAAGAGLRFRLSKKYPVDFSVDVAINRQSETSTYVYLGQRF